MTKRLFLSFLLILSLTATASAQFRFTQNETDGERHLGGPRLGNSKNQIWRTGIVIESGATMNSMQFGVPLPMNWREQRIISVNEDRMGAILANQIQHVPHPAGGTEMRVQLGAMRLTQPIEIVLEIELQNFELLPPDNPSQYIIPRQVPRDVGQYLQPTPYIESDNSTFRRMFNEITKDRQTDWDKVEALYSFVRNNVRYNDVAWRNDVKGALSVIRQPQGQWSADCKDMTCLFVALCRAGRIPARVVRVPGHCYAEFYLELKQDTRARNLPRGAFPPGFWFPCQVAGDYAFGGIPEQRVILQKGDSFPDPESSNFRGKTIWLKEYFMGEVAVGTPDPRFRWVRETLEK